MDLISHGLLGFVAGYGLKLDRKIRIVLMLACVAPDIDSISIIGGWESFLQIHRGVLHSFLGALLLSSIISCSYFLITRSSRKHSLIVLTVCLLGTFGHLFLDVLTPWSMAVLWPFSYEKITFDIAYFFDFVFFAVLLAASILVVYFKANVKKTRICAILTVILLATNFGIRYHQKGRAIETVYKMTESNPDLGLPTLRPDRWWIVDIEQGSENYTYHVYHVNSIASSLLEYSSVSTPVYTGSWELPVTSSQEAVNYSTRDERIAAFIDKSRLPAVEVTYLEGMWHLFWYDLFSKLSGGISSGMKVIVQPDGAMSVDFSVPDLQKNSEKWW